MYKSKKYIVSSSKKAVTTGDPISRHSVLRLTGESVTINGATYDETDDGWWMKASEGVKTNPGSPPKELKDGEKWVDVNTKTQTVVAYEGDKPVFATAVSTGLVDTNDKEKDHHTPPGTFRIREKHIAATMGRRRRERRAVLHRGRAVDHVLQRQLRAPRRLLAQPVRSYKEPRLREPRAAGREGALRVDRASPPRGLARRDVDGGEARHARGRHE